MKKLLSFLFAALLLTTLTGAVLAHTIAYDPQSTMGNIAVPVYNNSGAALAAGDVVVWDIGSSTGDDDAYVTTTTTADTSIVAGIIWPATINAGNTGSMVIWGLAQCDIKGASNAGSVLCSSTTAGESAPCLDNDSAFAITATDGTDTKVNCFVGLLP